MRRFLMPSILAAVVVCVGALAGTVSSAPLMAVYNPSPSMPVGWYLRVPLAPAVGRVVVIDPPLGAVMVGWPGHVRLIKPIAAVAGDHVCTEGNTVKINGAVVATVDIIVHGRPVRGWEGCRDLAPDEFYLLAPMRADSVDSRVYGPVRSQDIKGVFTSIWTETSK